MNLSKKLLKEIYRNTIRLLNEWNQMNENMLMLTVCVNLRSYMFVENVQVIASNKDKTPSPFGTNSLLHILHRVPLCGFLPGHNFLGHEFHIVIHRTASCF